MQHLKQRVETIAKNLNSKITKSSVAVAFSYLSTDCKSNNELPVNGFTAFGDGDKWGGSADSHAWFFAR